MADINVVQSVVQSNIVERKEKKNPPQLMLEVMDEVYENESPKNDSGIQIEKSLTVEDTDSEVDETNNGPVNVRGRLKATEIKKKHPKEKTKYKKPPRPCLFCKTNQTKLKRHILGRHKDEALVKPLLDMNVKEQDRQIAQLRKQAIRKFNIEMINHGETCFMRERRSLKNNKNSESNMPVMCSGCKGFYCKSYKSRHQLICPAAGTNLMIPVVSIAAPLPDVLPDDFKELLNSLHIDEAGSYVTTDRIILLIGRSAFSATRRKKDKQIETKKSIRGKMRLLARIYLQYRKNYKEQSEIQMADMLHNAADMYRRETITILGKSIDDICELEDEKSQISICGLKSGLKVSIRNLLKLTAQTLIGHFLIECENERSKRVVEFLQVFKIFENEIFGDAYYNLNYQRNVNLRKLINLSKHDDVQMLLKECKNILSSIDQFAHRSDSFTVIRSAVATLLIIFCARRGGQPVKLQLYQWEEAVNGEWVGNDDEPEDFHMNTMLITYQTGKGSNHLVPVLFPSESIQAMKFLTDGQIRKEAGFNEANPYIFATTKHSMSHARGWHCINDMLVCLSHKGAINATKNRHRVASLIKVGVV